MTTLKGRVTPQPEWTPDNMRILKERMADGSKERYRLLGEAAKLIEENDPHLCDGMLHNLVDFVVRFGYVDAFLQDLADHYATRKAWLKERRHS